jgi:UDP-glucuronate 4-epimerase
MKHLVTGAAGFIGYHVARALMERGDEVVGIDNLNAYYDVALKRARLAELQRFASGNGAAFTFVEEDIAEQSKVDALLTEHRPQRVIHLAAQPGVRFSLENPLAYERSNVTGFTTILEACRHFDVEHLTYASTSSVYGANSSMPFKESDVADHPVQFYAATKRANELMAHSYSHLFGLPTTGLRFFTVYGPWGRPDMAIYAFTKAILAGEPIEVFNHGNHARDFTYVDDIVDGVLKASDQVAAPDPTWDSATPDPSASEAPYRIFNIGNGRSVELMDFIRAIEAATGKDAIINYRDKQPGDVSATWADTSRLAAATGYAPRTSVEAGVARFVAWFRDYHGV